MKRVIVTSLLLIAPFCNAMNCGDTLVNESDWNVCIKAFDCAIKYINFQYKLYRARAGRDYSLNLSNQKIKTLPQNCPELLMLQLNDNLIEEIPENLNLPQLQNLYLENNFIKEFSSGLPSLGRINLTKNQITEIPASLPILVTMKLKSNLIQEITANRELPYLQDLDLSDNLIKFIDPSVLDQFENLRFLNLSKNYLQEDNIAQLREYAKDRNHLSIYFGKQKRILSIKSVKRKSKLADKQEEES